MIIVDFLQTFFVGSKIEKENGPNFSFIDIVVCRNLFKEENLKFYTIGKIKTK